MKNEIIDAVKYLIEQRDRLFAQLAAINPIAEGVVIYNAIKDEIDENDWKLIAAIDENDLIAAIDEAK